MSEAGRERAGLQIIVDELACEANGVCVDLLPEALELGDDDVLRVRVDALPPALVERAREAARVCPRQALRVVAPSELTQG